MKPSQRYAEICIQTTSLCQLLWTGHTQEPQGQPPATTPFGTPPPSETNHIVHTLAYFFYASNFTLKYCFVPPDFFPICGSKKNLQENTIAGAWGVRATPSLLSRDKRPKNFVLLQRMSGVWIYHHQINCLVV